ncbi:MAG: recombinase family protein, partial [Candidatus Shapirobacteria bacterium]
KSQDKVLNFFNDWKAEADNETRVARFNLGKTGKAKRGINPCKVPYGLRKIINYENDDPDKKQEVDIVFEKEAIIIRDIFNYYDQNGWGFRRIAEELNTNGTPAPKSKLWGYSTIKYILQNPTYTGLVRWGWRLSESKRSRTRLRQGHEGIITQGKHKPIISPEQFQRIQEKIAIRAKLGGRAIHSPGLLSGLIYCGRCHGHGYLSTGKQSKKSNAWSAYLCSKYAQYGKSGCSHRYIISKVKVEDAVVQKIKELASNPEAQDEFISQSKSSKKSEIKAKIKLINDTFEKNKEGRERIKNLLITQDFDSKMVAEFKDQLTKYDVQEIRQTKELEQLQKELNQESKTEKLTKKTILSLMNFDKIWETADTNEKKMLLATLIRKIIVSNEKNIYIEFNHQDKL